MNICQVSPYFPYREHIAGTKVESGYHIGGVEKHVYLISKHLSERGHNVSIITTRSPIHKSLNEPDGLDVVRLPMDLRIYNSNLTILNFMKLDLSRYDIIHAHTPVPAMADIAALKIFG